MESYLLLVKLIGYTLYIKIFSEIQALLTKSLSVKRLTLDQVSLSITMSVWNRQESANDQG